MELIIEKINEFIKWKIVRRVKDAIFRVKVLVRFLGLGWRWHDHDYQPTLDQFLVNLNLLADHILYHNVHSGCAQDYKRIKEAAGLISKALDDNYYEDTYEKPITAKYGKKIPYTPVDESLEIFRWVRIRTEETDKNRNTIHKLERKAMKEAREARERDWDKGWGILVENIRSWWC